jgi:hypothetical protein
MRRHFPPDSSWPHNTIAGERVSPDRDFLIAQLATIANPQTERELIVEHSGKIQFAVNLLRAQRQYAIRRGKLHADLPGGHHALGPAVELRRLRHAARLADKTGNLKPWSEAWAATSDVIRTTVWMPKVPPVEKTEGGFERPPITEFMGLRSVGFHMIAPYPVDALPLISVALRKHRTGRREVNPLAADLTDTIKTAFVAIAGPPGGSGRRKRMQDLQALARNIDTYFELDLYPADGAQIRALRRC